MKYQTRKRSLLLVFTIGLLATLAFTLACGGAGEPAPAPTTAAPAPTAAPSGATATPVAMDQPRYGGTLRFAMNLNLKSLDPAFGFGTSYHQILNDLYGTIVKAAPDFRIVPSLARSWEISSDGKAITFRLPSGAKFHDGTDVTAEAVKWHYDRVLDPDVTSTGVVATIRSIVDSVVVNDTLTFTFNLTAPDRSFLSALIDFPGAVASPTAVLEANSYSDPTGEFGRNPVGAGAFMFESWAPDQSVKLTRNPNYFLEGLPYLDSIIYQHIPDPQTRIAMIRTGETDFIGGGASDFNAKDLPLVEGNPNLKIITLPRTRTYTIGFSTDVAPYSNKDLRAAIAYAIDRETLVDVYFFGQAEPAYSPVAVGWAYNPDIRIYDYNPEKAKEALVKAGYPNGVNVTFSTGATPANIELAEIYQSMLKEVGITVDINTITPADYWQSVVQRKIHMVARWRSPRADPGRFLQEIFHSRGGGNVMGYNSKDFGHDLDTMIEEANAVYDIAEAKKLLDEIQRIGTEDVAHALTVYTKGFIIVSNRVEGLDLDPSGYYPLDELWLRQ